MEQRYEESRGLMESRFRSEWAGALREQGLLQQQEGGLREQLENLDEEVERWRDALAEAEGDEAMAALQFDRVRERFQVAVEKGSRPGSRLRSELARWRSSWDAALTGEVAEGPGEEVVFEQVLGLAQRAGAEVREGARLLEVARSTLLSARQRVESVRASDPQAQRPELEARLHAVESELARVRAALPQAMGFNALCEPTEAKNDEKELEKQQDACEDVKADLAALLNDYQELHGELLQLDPSDALSEDAPVIRVTEEQWCQLHIHGALMALVAQRTALYEELMGTARASYADECFRWAVQDWESMEAALWSAPSSPYEEKGALELPVREAEGGEALSWRLDGRDVGTPLAPIPVWPGLHHLSFASPTREGALVVEVGPAETLTLTFVDQERLSSSRAATPASIEPVQFTTNIGRWDRVDAFEPEEATPPEKERAWSLLLGAGARAFAGEVLVGGTVTGSLILRHEPTVELGLGLDVHGGDAWRYGGLSVSSLLRGRVEVLTRLERGQLRPVAFVSAGLLPPLTAATADVGAGLELLLPGRVLLRARGALSSTFFSDAILLAEPWASVEVGPVF